MVGLGRIPLDLNQDDFVSDTQEEPSEVVQRQRLAAYHPYVCPSGGHPGLCLELRLLWKVPALFCLFGNH